MVETDLFGKKVTPEEKYSLKSGEKISVSALRVADRETQIEAMTVWFYDNFEDPVELTPYESREGGYQFIYGGPYEAEDELQNEFGGIVPADAIKELTDELNHISWQWSGKSDNALDDYLFESITQASEHHTSFMGTLTNILELAKVEVPPPQKQHFLRLLYLSVIIGMETYLSDTFLTKVASDNELLRKFFEENTSPKDKKLSIQEALSFSDDIQGHFKKHFASFVWHRLAPVRSMFSNTLGVTFAKSDALDEAIRVRHDIVHRNGKTSDGKERQITLADIEKVADAVEKLVCEIEEQINL